MLNGFSYLSFAKSSSVVKRAAKRHLSFPKTLFTGLHNPNLPGVDEVFGRYTAQKPKRWMLKKCLRFAL